MDEYRYLEYRYEKGFVHMTAPVEVVGETEKRYKVRLVGVWVGRHAPETTMWVDKKNVVRNAARQPKDCSEYWWQNL